MKRLGFTPLVLMLSAVVAAFGQNQANRVGYVNADLGFIEEGLSGGWHEVQLARLALLQSGDTQVKNFAKALADDHASANAELKNIANSLGWKEDLPSEPPVPRKDMRTNTVVVGGYTALAGLQGWEFDREFVQQMVENHRSTIAKYETAQTGVKDPGLRRFIESTIPKLREHLERAEALNR